MNNMKTNKTNILYSRVSSKHQEINTSLDYQVGRLNEYSLKNKITSTTHIQDVDSGSKSTRKGMVLMEHMITSGIVDTIYITKLDRLYRSVLGGAKFIKLCLDNDCDIQATDESISTKSASSMLQINILLSIADYERECIRNRTQQGKRSTFELGKRPQGNIPIGYRKNGGSIVCDKSESEIVKTIFTSYTKHKSLSKVRDELIDKQYRTRRGNNFRRMAIYNIIKNPTYIGRVSLDGVFADGIHEPIISKNLFTRANNLLCK